MHLLVLALNYYPDQLGNAPILTGIAEGLASRGHKVSVVCAFPHHETGRVEAPYHGRFMSQETRNQVDIYRAFIKPADGGLKSKALNYLSFSISSLVTAIAKVRKIDVIFTPSPPITLGLVDIALRVHLRAPYIYNLQDLFPEAAVKLGLLSNPLVIKGFEWIERQVLTRADHLAVICEGFKHHAVRLGVEPDRVTVIPNFTDIQLIQPQAYSDYRVKWGINPEDIVILFSGRMGYSQNLKGVVEAWHLLRDQASSLNLRLVMVGDGQARREVIDMLKGDTRVTVARTQPREMLSDLLALADIGIAPLKRGLSSASVPSKILGLMAAGRAVIAQAEADTDTAKLIEEAECGVISPPETPRALADAILTLAMNPKRRTKMGGNGRTFAVNKYSEEAVVNAYEQLFLRVIKG